MLIEIINTNALNKVTSPSPLEGEGWGVKGIIAFVLAVLFSCLE